MCVDAEGSQPCDMLTAEREREGEEETALGRSQDRHNTAFLSLLRLKVFSGATLRWEINSVTTTKSLSELNHLPAEQLTLIMPDQNVFAEIMFILDVWKLKNHTSLVQ